MAANVRDFPSPHPATRALAIVGAGYDEAFRHRMPDVRLADAERILC